MEWRKERKTMTEVNIVEKNDVEEWIANEGERGHKKIVCTCRTWLRWWKKENKMNVLRMKENQVSTWKIINDERR